MDSEDFPEAFVWCGFWFPPGSSGSGATDFLLKPLDHLEGLLRIANLLEMRRLHIQLDTQRAALEDALRERSLELREAHLHREIARA
jgi:hypothetical protein